MKTIIAVLLSMFFVICSNANEKNLQREQDSVEKRQVRRMKARIRSFYETQLKDLDFQERRLKGAEALRKKRVEDAERREKARLEYIEKRSPYKYPEDTPAYQKHLEKEDKYAERRGEKRERFNRFQSQLENIVKSKKSFSEEEEYGLEIPARETENPQDAEKPSE